MEREADVLGWHANLPKAERQAWNHPSSVWRHFDKKEPKAAPAPKSRPTTGLTAVEEAEEVEGVTPRLQAFGKQSVSITSRSMSCVLRQCGRRVIGELLRRASAKISDVPTDDEIISAANVEIA